MNSIPASAEQNQQPTVPSSLYNALNQRYHTLKQYISWEDTLFENPNLGPGHKLEIRAIRRAVQRGKVKDAAGRTRINLTKCGEEIGASSDTLSRGLKFLAQCGVIPDKKLTPEIQENGEQWKRWYISLNEELLQTPDKIEPPTPRNHGGDRTYICSQCGKRHIIKRKVVTLICKDCGKESTLSDDSIDLSPVEQDAACPTDTDKNFCEQGRNLPDVLKPVTPPLDRKMRSGSDNEDQNDQVDPHLVTLAASEMETATALYLDIAGADPGHIEMIPKKAQKWTKLHHQLTRSDIEAHISGEKTIGTRLYHEDGTTRAFLVDADTEQDLVLLREGARKLAGVGFFPLLDSPPAARPHQVEGYHDVSEHGLVVADARVDKKAGWAEICRIAPEWGQLKERWPALAEHPVGNRVRLPGGKYVMPGFTEWCTLTSVADGEMASDGNDQARMLLSHQTPASLIPPLPEQLTEPTIAQNQVSSTAAALLMSANSKIDIYWKEKYAENGFLVAFPPGYLAACFNAEHFVTEFLQLGRNGKYYSPNGNERTASAGAYMKDGKELVTDLSNHGLRSDGTHDTSDAFELYCKVNRISKEEGLRRLGKEKSTQAKQEIERCARSGTSLPAWIEEIITPAGWRRYEHLKVSTSSTEESLACNSVTQTDLVSAPSGSVVAKDDRALQNRDESAQASMPQSPLADESQQLDEIKAYGQAENWPRLEIEGVEVISAGRAAWLRFVWVSRKRDVQRRVYEYIRSRSQTGREA